MGSRRRLWKERAIRNMAELIFKRKNTKGWWVQRSGLVLKADMPRTKRVLTKKKRLASTSISGRFQKFRIKVDIYRIMRRRAMRAYKKLAPTPIKSRLTSWGSSIIR
jgi:hypothetical protein